VEPARIPSTPYGPHRDRLILMGIFAGFGAGLAIAFLMEQKDTTFGNADDFRAFTTMPVIGVIPAIPNIGKPGGRSRGMVPLKDPDSGGGEQYRIPAMKAQKMCIQDQARIVMVTSAAGGEGKSLTAINMSMALTALVDGPVLLVDADMRKPRLHE